MTHKSTSPTYTWQILNKKKGEEYKPFGIFTGTPENFAKVKKSFELYGDIFENYDSYFDYKKIS